MYQLKYKDYILHDMRLADEKLIIRDPSVKLAVSKAGEMSFTVDAEHPYLSNLRRMSGLVELLDGTLPIYRGRITSDTKDFYGAHKIETEGIMAVLNDSIIPPFNFPEDFAEDDPYKAAAASGNVVEFFFRWILSQHNAQVTAEQQIKPGVITVSDQNNYITRSSEEYATAMSTISDKLIKSALGGYLLIRYEDDGNYLDYYAALPLTNTQSVEFAENLLDLSSETDGTNIYTAILPEGKDGLTIEALPDGDLTDDLVKSGLTIYSKSGMATYGRITRHIKWDDVTVAANLQCNSTVLIGDFSGQHFGRVKQTVPARNIDHVRADFRQSYGLACKQQAVFCVSVFSVKKYFSYHTALALLALILASSSSMPGASKPTT
jgi:hypothetical protein